MTYKASWDNATKIITGAITVLFLAIILGSFIDGGSSGPGPYFMAVMIVAIYAVCYVFRPVHYILTKDKLIIHRPLNNVSLGRNKIASVELLDDEMLADFPDFRGRRAVRLLLGSCQFQTREYDLVCDTQEKDGFDQTIDGKNIIVTPDETEDFVNQFVVRHSMHP
ncbi:hypothetical protein PEC18_09110 [Paucibacter sp. O1-1]|nr:hypothetical protein [Paucibacter sp. O1-1]MDA3826014.1 hypothetical protein [Paucibacter sp. O1-1]